MRTYSNHAVAVLAALGAAMLVSGCGGDNTTNLSNQTFIGTLGDGSVLTLNFGTQSGTSIPLTGTLTHTPASGTVNLMGTYTVSNAGIAANGGSYTLNGTYANGTASGTYTGPSGTGAFVAFNGDSNSVTVYCGTYTGSSMGEWNLVKKGNSVAGAYSTGKLINGSVDSYNMVRFQIADDSAGNGSGSGTISGASISGTWMVGNATGNWSGNVCT
jgi:hypothetical protein